MEIITACAFTAWVGAKARGFAFYHTMSSSEVLLGGFGHWWTLELPRAAARTQLGQLGNVSSRDRLVAKCRKSLVGWMGFRMNDEPGFGGVPGSRRPVDNSP